MSGTRMARSGRCRLLVCLGAIVLMFGLFVIFHSLQEQTVFQERIRCEQQKEIQDNRLRVSMNKNKKFDDDISILEATRRDLEARLEEAKEKHAKQEDDANERFEQLQQTHKQLQITHNELVNENSKAKREHLEGINSLEKKLQTLKTEVHQEKIKLSKEVLEWKDKYEKILREKNRLEMSLTNLDSNASLQKRIKELEQALIEYKSHCSFRPDEASYKQPFQTSNHPLGSPVKSISFKEQQIVSPGLYQIMVKATNLTHINDKKAITNIEPMLPLAARNNNSLILNSVENFQIAQKPIIKPIEETETQLKGQPLADATVAGAIMSPAAVAAEGKMVAPLSAPRKSSSTVSAKQERHVLEANEAQPKKPANATSSTSTSSLPPLPLPPNQRKIPANVAPIPDNFEALMQNNPGNQPKEKPIDQNRDNEHQLEAEDIDAAVEDMQKNENDDGNNNRYAHVVNDLENGKEQKHVGDNGNEDSGAHEIKDHDLMNDANFNLPPEDENNFFDNGKNDAADEEKRKNEENEEDDMMGAGGAADIAVKNHNHMLDAESLNNEVAGDQGKEIPDGFHLEDNIEEDEDEDDYSNHAARKKGAEAFRH